ncbi:hypothetical protein AN403_6114 [Pseudomonas fluorescens]|uniref:Uncharacterized protein n=1 Tax=Pseudomonas fluorescens TaxID=294 RepID=A0A0P9BFX4_PSEFL|nr:hypothetical protein AN403_6114 [Pseudomonas fluorescens]
MRLSAALATAADMSMPRAAADKLPRSAARTNNCKSSKRSIKSTDYQKNIERDCSFSRFYLQEK